MDQVPSPDRALDNSSPINLSEYEIFSPPVTPPFFEGVTPPYAAWLPATPPKMEDLPPALPHGASSSRAGLVRSPLLRLGELDMDHFGRRGRNRHTPPTNDKTSAPLSPQLYFNNGEEYIRLLREAQKFPSNGSSSRVSLASSKRDSPRWSPKSPPNSPNTKAELGTSLHDEALGNFYLNYTSDDDDVALLHNENGVMEVVEEVEEEAGYDSVRLRRKDLDQAPHSLFSALDSLYVSLGKPPHPRCTGMRVVPGPPPPLSDRYVEVTDDQGITQWILAQTVGSDERPSLHPSPAPFDSSFIKPPSPSPPLEEKKRPLWSLDLRRLKIGKVSIFSNQFLYTLALTNLLSFLLGGIGVYFLSRKPHAGTVYFTL